MIEQFTLLCLYFLQKFKGKPFILEAKSLVMNTQLWKEVHEGKNLASAIGNRNQIFHTSPGNRTPQSTVKGVQFSSRVWGTHGGHTLSLWHILIKP